MTDELKDQIRQTLETILASPPFRPITAERGGRYGKFLRYIVEEHLKGNTINERVIARELFEDSGTTDDPIVRSTAHIVRQKLREYYYSDPPDPLRIEIPLGGYVPVFKKSGIATPIAVDHEVQRQVNETQKSASLPPSVSTPELVRRDRNPINAARYMEVMRSLTPISERIKSFCEQHGVTPIDQFIPIRACPGLDGWPEGKVSKFPIVEPHDPLPELQRLMETFPPDGAINQLYSLQSWECDRKIGDEKKHKGEIPDLQLTVAGGDWRHISALQEAWLKISEEKPNVKSDPEYFAFHQRFEAELANLIHEKKSNLYCNLNTEALLVTSDKQIVLARRSGPKKNAKKGGTAFSHGRWSASFEEQVMRRKEEDDTSDLGDVFACAARGAWEEFGVTIAESRLMGFGAEWGNFTLVLMFLLHCNETYEEIRNYTWEHLAPDPDEAVAIDCIDAEKPDELAAICKLDTWTPSEKRSKKSARLETDADNPLVESKWHPVARARLLMWLRHRFG